MITDKRISEIIKEEVSVLDFFRDLNNQSGEMKPWNPETKMDRMKPLNAYKSKGSIPTKDYGVIRGYNDWKKNYSGRMGYPEYCEKFGVRR